MKQNKGLAVLFAGICAINTGIMANFGLSVIGIGGVTLLCLLAIIFAMPDSRN